jgi:hypothetical protein
MEEHTHTSRCPQKQKSHNSDNRLRGVEQPEAESGCQQPVLEVLPGVWDLAVLSKVRTEWGAASADDAALFL